MQQSSRRSHTPMQCCVGAEMLIGGMSKLDCVPTSTMFSRSSGGPKKCSMEHSGNSLAEAIDNCQSAINNLQFTSI